MSTLLYSVNHLEINNSQSSKTFNNNKIKHILKSKENIIQHKYRKELKRKLKKYRLRPDGHEDQEVLDVSKILVSSLRIKSPNNKEESGQVDYVLQNELRPKNYLFKMGRRKQILTKSESDIPIANNNKINEAMLSASTSNQHVEKMEKIKNRSKLVTNVMNDYDFISSKENKKKETNAFKLLMESRNKSIGSNSPGKDKVLTEVEDQDSIEKRNVKVKRTLLLQKMAEAKGSLKNKEVEEIQEKIIKDQMEKRAERLKSLILRYESKPTSKIKKKKIIETELMKLSPKIDEDQVSHKRKLSLVDLFQDSVIEKPATKYVSEEETEFLKKLSPSLKKKENMLSYFKKIEKDDSSANEDHQSDNVIIKVKLNSKSKKKIKKKKLSLNKESCDDVKLIDPNDSVNMKDACTVTVFPDENNTTIIKEKNVNKHIVNPEVEVERPRRNIKRPAKYTDEVLISSSDEELHIFTPKKKKRSEPKIDYDYEGNDEIKQNLASEIKRETREVTKSKVESGKQSYDKLKPKLPLKVKKEAREETKSKFKIKSGDQQKKPTKLAPIFNTKLQLDVAALEAKQRFLSSGVPDKLKKVIEKQNNIKFGSTIFDTVVHIQQIETSLLKANAIDYNIISSDDDFECLWDAKDLFKNLLSYENQHNKIRNFNEISTENEIQKVLLNIKKEYPKFPVYRTYRLLKDKNRGEYRDNSFLDLDNSVEIINGVIDVGIDSPDRLNWTDKYKPMMSKEIIGNFETTKELKKWLVSWTENDVKSKKHNSIDSDSSDFYYSDTDSKDSVKVTNNLLILNGPVGSGKTSIVYAVAMELAIKVLEVNASSKRTGKIMLQDLQEATQSHKVNRGKGSSQEYSQKSQEAIQVEISAKTKKRGRPKKSLEKLSKKIESVCKNEVSSQPLSQDSTRTCMSLILIDDADIVFEQDDGFCSAIVQLVHCSKRPVILITTSTTCSHLQRFIQTAKIINTYPLQPRMLGTWLDILCLVENNICSPGMGAHLLNYFHGDIRKTINYLQFYFTKVALTNEKTQARCNDLKLNVDDENSGMSWSDREVKEENNDILSANSENIDSLTWYLSYEKKNLLHFEFPIKLFNMWWNLPRFLNVPLDDVQVKEITEQKHFKQSKKSLEMLAISSALDAISVSDYFRRRHFDNDISDPPWLNREQDSVSEQEALDDYNKCEILVDEISHAIVAGSIVHFQKTLAIDHDNNLQIPGMNVQRDRNKTISRHNKLTNFLNSSAALDRRGLGLDYWSSCRTICRIEKTKTDTNLKRNNRYCHYLKSLNVLCNNDYFDNLSKGLCLRKD
ncbi:unnamed protein product [Chilo suppressalis]|uniref:AAA+ ATPase domain-containing protein n=1 Tax=Chilo suppressalis TaxID=168631 RepID=A0ABN8ASG5_CHISP|nr:unnamed protein product [Chilo suppressalis]